MSNYRLCNLTLNELVNKSFDAMSEGVPTPTYGRAIIKLCNVLADLSDEIREQEMVEYTGLLEDDAKGSWEIIQQAREVVGREN